MARGTRILAVLALAVMLSYGSGCTTPNTELPPLEPSIAPPLIGQEGLLKVGMDTAYPPFAGTDKGQLVGLDIDVASALADHLGLRIEIVDVKLADIPAALDDGSIDIGMGGMPITQAVLADVTFAGSYVIDGPVFYSATETTESALYLADKRIAAQTDSEASWRMVALFGEGSYVGYETLKEALEAAQAGEVDMVACDAVVAGYIVRDMPTVRYVGQVDFATPLGIAVAKDTLELETAVRDGLDALAADGVLDTILAKWVPDIPELVTATTE